MRTRNADSSKSAAAKNTPPARKSASKSPANTKPPQTKRTSTIRTRQAKKNEDSPVQNVSVDEKPEQSSGKTFLSQLIVDSFILKNKFSEVVREIKFSPWRRKTTKLFRFRQNRKESLACLPSLFFELEEEICGSILDIFFLNIRKIMGAWFLNIY